jgi:hypothetical protein
MSFLQAIGILSLRLWAIMRVPTLVSGLVSLLPGSVNVGNRELYYYYAANALYGLLALGAFIFARPIVVRITRGLDQKEVHAGPLSAEDLLMIGSFLIGFWFLLAHLAPALLGTGMAIWSTKELSQDIRNVAWTLLQAPFVTDWLNVLVALFLTFRARDIARMFVWLRNANRPPVAEVE